MTTAAHETAISETQDVEGLVKIKIVHGVTVYVEPLTGVFKAKFSQGAGLKWFDRPTLTQLELLIAQHVLDFSGSVEAATAPTTLVNKHDLDSLEQRLSTEVSGRYYDRIYQRRPTTTFTGVQRVERNRGGTTVVFRLGDGSTTSIEREYVKPDPTLDANFYGLAHAYLESQKEWKAKFDTVVAQYQTVTAQEIVDELRKQGARVGRA